MNRIQQLVNDPSFALESHAPVVEFGRFERSEPDAQHAFFSPVHYEKNYAYPLIVWLHGERDDERQLRRIMPLVSMRNYVAVAPRGTVAGDVPGFSWDQDLTEIAAAENRVFTAVKAALRRFNVSRKRIFVAGYGCGGTMALRMALNHPLYFAGGASFGGAFPTNLAPLGQLHDVRQLKLLLATCRDSVDYPADQVCEHLRLFHTAGMAVCLRQYPCGDELTTAMLADMDRWIMDQVLQPAAAYAGEASTGR